LDTALDASAKHAGAGPTLDGIKRMIARSIISPT
jgi:hypothetical protein